LRILQVIPYFYPLWAYGGSAKVAYSISREIVRRGHEIVVYTSDVKDDCSRVTNDVKELDEIQVHCFRSVGLITVRKMKLFITPDIIRTVKSDIQRFDIVHLHECRTFQNIVVHHYAKKYGVPYVLQAHGSLPRIMAKQRLKWIYDVLFGYRLLRDASKVIALSRVEAEQYKDMSVPEEKIAIIPNGIDLSEYADLPPKGCFREKFGIKEEEKIVLYLGRIHRIKGLDILVKAFAKVIEDLDDVRLVVVGPDDGYLGELKALINALRIEDNVLILGPLYGDDKLEAYIDADVYVLPSRYETFPMSLLEAVACGTPVILTENCGVAEYFRDKVGLVVDLNADHLREALLGMLLDQDRRNAFREKCKTVIKEFEISKSVSKLEEVYEEIVR
jgi:glycosyltransferase involved in cell wall biosynthesis